MIEKVLELKMKEFLTLFENESEMLSSIFESYYNMGCEARLHYSHTRDTLDGEVLKLIAGEHERVKVRYCAFLHTCGEMTVEEFLVALNVQVSDEFENLREFSLDLSREWLETIFEEYRRILENE